MLVFCSFEQQFSLIELAKQYEIKHYLNLVFRKNFSAQVLKANMRIVGNAEYGLLLYRDKLPKFNNNGKMIFNVMDWESDDITSPIYQKIHPTQKPIKLLEKIISIFTDPGDVVIDPVAGSGSTIIAAENIGRKAYGFEIKKDFYKQASAWIDECAKVRKEIKTFGYSETLMEKASPNQGLLFSQLSEATL
jgi:site-specific DNA-methyltransferase (adenine-specific)